MTIRVDGYIIPVINIDFIDYNKGVRLMLIKFKSGIHIHIEFKEDSEPKSIIRDFENKIDKLIRIKI